MRRKQLLITSLFASLVGIGATGCAVGAFRQVSFAGEVSPAVDTARQTVHVVRNGEMKDTVLEGRIRIHLEEFLLRQGYILASPDTADVYVLATFGWGPRIVGSTASVFRPESIGVVRSPTGDVVARRFNPGRMEELRVPSLEKSVWLMVLSSDARHYRATGVIRNLWRGEAAMRGTPESMSASAPYLIVPALRYFGKGTIQTLLLDVREKDLALK